jgi:hypothetical protein
MLTLMHKLKSQQEKDVNGAVRCLDDFSVRQFGQKKIYKTEL